MSEDKYLKTYATKWDDSIPLNFPQTENITTKLNASADENSLVRQ